MATGILEIVVVAAGVNLLYALVSRRCVEGVFIHHAPYGILAVRRDKHAESLVVVAQYPVGAAADDDTGLFRSEIADNAALADEDGIVVEGFIDNGMLLSVKISSQSLALLMFCSFSRTKSVL